MLRDEVVRTGLDSATRLVMADSTNLSLGPSASLKLDRTVFDDEHHYRDVAVRLTSGAVRFVTGHSEKAAYKITTPLATIGVRGTTLDILSQRGQTIVNLQEGASSVCTLSFECVQLTKPGDTAVITVERRQDHDQEDQHAAMDFRQDLQRRGRTLQHHAICQPFACRDASGR